ncbi:MAG: putative LPS assembly protein LptD [Hyphomicrobiales bacterium]
MLLPDSLYATGNYKQTNDSTAQDSLQMQSANQFGLDTKIHYYAEDTNRFDYAEQKLYLYKNAKIEYEDIVLNADYIIVDFRTKIAYAAGVPDSTGELVGTPVFKEGSQTFEAKTINYNYETKKGYIKDIFAKEGEGYLHGQTIKKFPDNTINIFRGSYTTCDLKEHPHYEFKFKKAKVIPGDLIVTGPASISIGGVTAPILPFGIFPNKAGRRSGVLIPTYGESNDRGFYFENGGYYWAINDYMDLRVLGDIYTGGSWAIKPLFNYVKRYKFKGYFDAGISTNVIGKEGDTDYSKEKSFRVRWIHTQDPKANPTSTFSANVDIQSNNFNQYNVQNYSNRISSDFNSSVSYSKSWGSYFNLSVAATHNQNNTTKMVTVVLPNLSFNVNRVYPFRSEGSTGRKWYQNISVDYKNYMKNQYSTPDSLFLKGNWSKNLVNGMQHQSSINSNIKLFRFFNLNTNLTLTDRMYSRSFDQSYNRLKKVDGTDSTYQKVTDTIPGFKNEFDYAVSSSITTNIYGLVSFKKGFLRAIRHVFTPSISFNYTPSFADPKYGYYANPYNPYSNDTTFQNDQYYRFNTLFGTPPNQKSGSIGFNFQNNLEIKVRDRNDTITGTRKIKLLESFSISGNYDLARDSVNWSLITINARTTLFDKVNITLNSTWDPYTLDTNGRRTNKSEWEVNKKLLRLRNVSWSLGFGYTMNNDTFKKDKKQKKDEEDQNNQQNTDDFPDPYNQDFGNDFGNEEPTPDAMGNAANWNVPWSLNFSYNLNYNYTPGYPIYRVPEDKNIVQTLQLSGSIDLTPKWKVSAQGTYDFINSKINYSSVGIQRDLHCWQMAFNWVPLGPYKSWNFTINVKASMLQDLKLDKKNDYRDNRGNPFTLKR